MQRTTDNGQRTVRSFDLITLFKMTENITNKPTPNIDATEIAKFEAMASIWWDRQGDLKALHDINGLRLNYINQRAPLTGKAVLDVGCGGGILSEAMASMGAVVTGIDISDVALGVARQHLSESGLQVEYFQASAEQFARTRSDRFDLVTCLELLEHVPDPASVVAACKTLVRPGGDVFFATLNRNLKSFLFAVIGAEYILGLVRRGTHTYRKFIKPAELKTWAADFSLLFKDLTGLHYNPILRKYTLGGNTHVNYLAHFQRI